MVCCRRECPPAAAAARADPTRPGGSVGGRLGGRGLGEGRGRPPAPLVGAGVAGSPLGRSFPPSPEAPRSSASPVSWGGGEAGVREWEGKMLNSAQLLI